MKNFTSRFSKPIGFVLVCLAALFVSSCASLTPDQVQANSVTRHEQRAEGIPDPMKEK